MNITIFGWMRIRHIETARISLAGQWIANRRSFWQRSLDRLGDLFNEPDPVSPK